MKFMQIVICFFIIAFTNNAYSFSSQECPNTFSNTLQSLNKKAESIKQQGYQVPKNLQNQIAVFTIYLNETRKTVAFSEFPGKDGVRVFSITEPQTPYSDYNYECVREAVNIFCPGEHVINGNELQCKDGIGGTRKGGFHRNSDGSYSNQMFRLFLKSFASSVEFVGSS